MKFTVSSLILYNKFKLLIGIVKKNDFLPILDNFLFDIKKNKLKITATDLETTISSSIEIISDITCKIVVPAKLIMNLIKNIKDNLIDFYIKEKIIEIKTTTGYYSFTMQDCEEFPTIPIIHKYDQITINKNKLLYCIKKTIFATSNDELRSIITGVLIKMSNYGMILVATDAHVLVKCVQKDVKLKFQSEFIIPKKSLNLLKNILEKTKDINIIIEYDAENLSFIFEDEILVCRLIDGKFPDYESILPSDNNNVLLVKRVNLLNAIERISIFTNHITKILFCKLSYNKLVVTNDNNESSHRAIEYINCDYNSINMKIGFNSILLKKMVSYFDSEYIIFKIKDHNSAIVLLPENKSEGLVMIIMPTIYNE